MHENDPNSNLARGENGSALQRDLCSEAGKH